MRDRGQGYFSAIYFGKKVNGETGILVHRLFLGLSIYPSILLAAPSTSSCIIGVNSRKSIGLVYTHLHIIKWAPLPLAKRDLHFERKVLSTWVHGYLVLACYLIDVACPDGSVYIHESTRYQIRYSTRGEVTMEARHIHTQVVHFSISPIVWYTKKKWAMADNVYKMQ